LKTDQKLDLDYPNLPYLIDGDTKIAETMAILHYIPLKAGRKELLGDTDDKFIQVEQALGVITDVRNDFLKVLGRKEDFEAAKEEAFTKGLVKSKLEMLNKNLEGKEWLTGFLSIADFFLIELLELIHKVDPSRLEVYPNLMSFLKRYAELPETKAHRQSENFVKRWVVPGMFAWSDPDA
jgi:glutathione S-transferase